MGSNPVKPSQGCSRNAQECLKRGQSVCLSLSDHCRKVLTAALCRALQLEAPLVRAPSTSDFETLGLSAVVCQNQRVGVCRDRKYGCNTILACLLRAVEGDFLNKIFHLQEGGMRCLNPGELPFSCCFVLQLRQRALLFLRAFNALQETALELPSTLQQVHYHSYISSPLSFFRNTICLVISPISSH